MIPIAEKGLFKVVQAHEVETWSCMGWHVVAVMETEEQTMVSETENFQMPFGPNMPYSGSGMAYQSACSTRWKPTRHPTFLMCLGEDVALAKFQQDVVSRDKQIVELSEKLKQYETAQVATADRVAKAEARIENLVRTTVEAEQHARVQGERLAVHLAETEEKRKLYEEIIEKDKIRKRTAFERVVEGEYNDAVEGIEERAVG
jgi:hypothetical protein